MRIKVIKGQTVRIALSSNTSSKAAAVEYVVRDFPALGVLDTPIPAPEDRTKATVIYQAASTSKGSIDRFTVSSRYPGGYYSAPVQIIIELSEPKAELEVPLSIDFGTVILGDEKTRKILLKNSGNIAFKKVIELPAPFELIEPAEGKVYILPGDSLILKIKCRPKKTGSFNLNYGFQNKPTTTFIGNALAPFTLSKKELELSWNDSQQNRNAELTIRNQAKTSISIKVRPPLRTQHIREDIGGSPLTNSPLVLPAGESKIIHIALPKEDVESFAGTLKISSPHYSQNVPLKAAATPAQIKLELPNPALDRIDFGVCKPEKTISRTFMIKNLGGTSSNIALAVLPPFQIAENSGSTKAGTFTIHPQSSAIFTIQFKAPSQPSGRYADILKISTDVNAYSIRLASLVSDPESMAGKTALNPQLKKSSDPSSADTPLAKRPLPALSSLPPLPDPETGEDHRSPSGFYTRDYVTREFSNNIPSPTSLALHKADLHELVFAWKLPSPDLVVFELDMRQMLINQSNFGIESVWVPFHDVDFTRTDDMIYASIKGLDPSSFYEFRILTVGTAGKYSQPSQAFGARTQSPPDYVWIKWIVWLFILILLAFLIRLSRKSHKLTIPMPTYWPRTIPWPFD
ncbi:MAG: hypothetical protein QM496_12935 [Verrucomicrobiota bacterium]